MKKILFLLKEKQYSMSLVSYGLMNSAIPVAEHLRSIGCHCKIVQVVDANSIDHEVHEYKPDIVILEAVWVEAEKLNELMHIKQYRHILWIVRVHSNMGFLASEPHSIRVLKEYIALDEKRLIISFNNDGFERAIADAWDYDFSYLPNIVKIYDNESNFSEEKNHMHVGCFGALRLIKNQCFQAICAMQAANALGKKLCFHVTPHFWGDSACDPILNALRYIFQDSKHELCVHNWMPLHNFLELVKKMDLGLQLSYTESFNIVTADFVNCGKLIIVSDAISWMPPSLRVSTTDYEEVVEKIVHVYKNRNNNTTKGLQRRYLREYNDGAKRTWDTFIRKQHGLVL
jgi:hypothetical protein